ncbi:hypothetical protein G7046_g7369 [Stylonectria norvegica]|nr:hypothetical protein G7046_g7369 [Stylonectria norvegica]
MKHLIVIGACYLDTILTVPFFPSEDSKLRATSLNIRRGGNCPNSLEVLEQLLRERDAVQLHLVSCLPNASSSATRRVFSSFGEHSRIDFRHCIHREASTEAASSYILRSEASGSRTLVNCNDLPEMTVAEFEAVAQSFSPDQETWWHFELTCHEKGRIPDTTLECIHVIHRVLPKAHISVEIEKPGREGLPELADEADVVFYSRTWAERRGHASAEACLRNERHQKASLALCTWGADGAAALSRPAGQCFRCPVKSEAGEIISVVDAVGAGDTFVAGMLYGLLCRASDWSIGQQLSFAVDLATLKVQREGFAGLGADVLGGPNAENLLSQMQIDVDVTGHEWGKAGVHGPEAPRKGLEIDDRWDDVVDSVAEKTATHHDGAASGADRGWEWGVAPASGLEDAQSESSQSGITTRLKLGETSKRVSAEVTDREAQALPASFEVAELWPALDVPIGMELRAEGRRLWKLPLRENGAPGSLAQALRKMDINRQSQGATAQ